MANTQIVARGSSSVVLDGVAYRVRRLSDKPSQRVAAKYASRGRGYAKRVKRAGYAPVGLPTCSRIGNDALLREYSVD